MKIKIITDSTAYIGREDLKKLGVDTVRLSYILNEKSEIEEYPGEFKSFFDRLLKSDEPMTTSQPSTGDFVNCYKRAFEEGYDEVIAIVLSSKLSGTYSNALLAKDMLGDKMITIIDSETTVANLRFMVEDAVRLIEEGRSSEEIVNYIEEKKKTMGIDVIVGDLKYLAKGGRMSTVSSMLGNLLNIKPILRLANGQLDLLDKARGMKQALKKVINSVDKLPTRIAVCHILCYEEAEAVKEILKEKYPNVECSIEEIGPVVGSHLGPGTLGVCIY